MARHLIVALLSLLMGAFLGNTAAKLTARRHQHSRSVMGLAQFHLERLERAAQAAQCPAYDEERSRLASVYSELLLAFPLAYSQDAQFRIRADALRNAVQPADAAVVACANAAAVAKQVKDACDECHREYR